MSMKTDALIFDVDGTLWDPRETIACGWNAFVLEKEGFDPGFTRERVQHFLGKPLDYLEDNLFPKLPKEKRHALGRECINSCVEWMKVHPGELYPKLPETICELAGQLPLYIVSNCAKGYIDNVLRPFNGAVYFKDQICYDDTKLSKAENLKILIQRNGLLAPCYVGDTTMDYEACKEAGIPMVYARYGMEGQPPAGLPVIDTFEDLLTLFLEEGDQHEGI